MDDQHRRTINVGIIIAFVIFAVSFVIPFLMPGMTAQWVAIGFNVAALLFLGAWLLAVRKGFRLEGPSKVETRAKEKRKREREKLAKLRR